jgi:cyclopropane fatty-acyl-phospholipid synthase-like methyltransferase
MAHEAFPRSSAYDPSWVFTNHMGPNVLWLIDALTQHLVLEPGMRVLDMGCGTAASSIFLAREFGVEVWAADLWVPPYENFRRIREAGLHEQVYAVHGEARAYPFQKGFFDALVSVDSYHYWGCEAGYVDYAARFLKPGGRLGVIVPGDAGDRDPTGTFHSAAWWRELWEQSEEIVVERAEMLEGGWDLWWRFCEASVAWHGEDSPGAGDAALLLDNEGLGFTRAVARRVGQ